VGTVTAPGAHQPASRDAIKEARRAVDAAESTYRRRLAAARDALARVEQGRERSVGEARRELHAAGAAYERAVANAEARLEQARAGRRLAAYGRVSLFESRLVAPEGVVPLSAAVRATVEASGIKTEKSDDRELVLLLDTPSFDAVVACNPADSTAVRQFAAAINTAAKNAESHLAAHAQAIAAAEQALEAARGDRARVDRAEAELARVEADTAELDASRAAVEAAQSDTSELDARRSDLRELDPKARVADRPPRVGVVLATRGWWRRRSRRARFGIVALAVVALLATAGAFMPADEEAASSAGAAAPPASEPEPAQPAPPPVVKSIELSVAPTPAEVDTPTVLLKGYVTPGSRLTVNGRAVKPRANRFSVKQRLRMGRNVFAIDARQKGWEAADSRVVVTRVQPSTSLELASPLSGAVSVQASSFTISGFASAGARVRLGGVTIDSDGGRFSQTVDLRHGRNVFWVRTDRDGYKSRGAKVVITRKMSPEEVRDAFVASAQTIAYSQLIKSPASYTGTKVKYYGEIFQIQQAAGGGGMMLLSVTDLGYGFWTDEVWVNYDGHVAGAEGDMITIYGVVTGSKSYETQIGGERYVPEIDARYLAE
jgi:hypothetical protein